MVFGAIWANLIQELELLFQLVFYLTMDHKFIRDVPNVIRIRLNGDVTFK